MPNQITSIHNLRDLVGLATSDGRRVRSGRLYRSANPGTANDDDIARLRHLGIDVVIDFRAAEEKSGAERGFGEAFDWVALPVLEGSMAMNELLPRLLSSSPDDMDALMLQAYRDFPTRHQAAFCQFMRMAESGRTMLYHCTTGKDRTGFASLLLLSALGVPQDAILHNYLESNQRNQRLIQGLLARLSAHGVAPEVAMPLLEVRAGYLEESLQTIERECGGMERFLADTLAVDTARLRQHYLEA